MGTLLAQTRYGGAVAACGLIESGELATTVMPFILRGVSLLGINSVEASPEIRAAVWARLERDLDLDLLDELVVEVPLAGVTDVATRMLGGDTRGRTVVACHTESHERCRPHHRGSLRRDRGGHPPADLLVREHQLAQARYLERFGIQSQEDADLLQPMAYNQGFYNLFLALGTAAGLVMLAIPAVTQAGLGLTIFTLLSMVFASLVLLTSNRALARAAMLQGGPPRGADLRSWQSSPPDG